MKKLLYIMILLQIVLCACVSENRRNTQVQKQVIDLEQIRERGKIIAVTDFNSANYFIYKGRPMGYQFEILEDFADYIGLKLELKVENDLKHKKEMLENNECDIIAINMVINQDVEKDIAYTIPLAQTKPVLVQRHNKKRNHSYYIKNQMDLAGRIVYVPKNSSYSSILRNVFEEIDDTIYIREVDVSPVKLMDWVSRGKIDYTVCYENIAIINKIQYKNIDIKTPINFNQNMGWMIRSDSPELLTFINDWMKEYKRTTKYHVLYKKYFINRNIERIAKSDYSTFRAGKMSAYDYAIKKYSQRIGWDWRLLASLIYQESRFNPNVKSWAGAYGIMQLMPRTGRSLGVDPTSAPEEQIRAGVNYLKWLDKRFENDIPDTDERIKFVLASYNVGYGHVQDARRLTRKYNMNPNVWKDSVEFFLLKKSKSEYYKDPVVKHGYCRGTETYKYVNEIIERYQHYTNLYVEN